MTQRHDSTKKVYLLLSHPVPRTLESLPSTQENLTERLTEKGSGLWRQEVEVVCILPEASVGKDIQRRQLDFGKCMAKMLHGTLRIVERQLYYDLVPEITQLELNRQLQEELGRIVGGSPWFHLEDAGRLAEGRSFDQVV